MAEKFNGINLFDKVDSPVPIYTTEGWCHEKVDITRHGMFENLNSRHLKELEVSGSLTMTMDANNDKLTAVTSSAEMSGFKAGETVTFTFHGANGGGARASGVADANGVISNGTQLTILDGGQGYGAAPTAVYADKRAEDSVAPIKDGSPRLPTPTVMSFVLMANLTQSPEILQLLTMEISLHSRPLVLL